jgi:ankyrin repeat protein
VLLENVVNLGAVNEDSNSAFQTVSEYVNTRNAEGKTPLHFAAKGPLLGAQKIALWLSNTARLLLEHGADVNARGNDNSTALHIAAQYGRVNVVDELLEHGANVGAEDDEGRTALQVASSRGRVEIVRLLSERGAT